MLICYKFHVHLSCLYDIFNRNWHFYVLFSLKNTKRLPLEYMLLCRAIVPTLQRQYIDLAKLARCYKKTSILTDKNASGETNICKHTEIRLQIRDSHELYCHVISMYFSFLPKHRVCTYSKQNIPNKQYFCTHYARFMQNNNIFAPDFEGNTPLGNYNQIGRFGLKEKVKGK